MKNIPLLVLLALGLFACNLCKLSDSGNTGNTPPAPPAANAKRFVNSRANLTGKLAENYVDFSFNYPGSWEMDPEAGKPGAANFAKVARNLPGSFTQENFAVGYFAGTGTAIGDQLLFPQLAQQLSSQFSNGFPEYQKVSEGKTRIGSYDGYEFRFKAQLKNTPKGNLPIWGRAVMLPNRPGQKNGVVLIMLATSLAPEISGVEDVGVKGEMPVILNSFRLGS